MFYDSYFVFLSTVASLRLVSPSTVTDDFCLYFVFIHFSKLSNEDIHTNDEKHNVLNLHGSRRGCSPLTRDQ